VKIKSVSQSVRPKYVQTSMYQITRRHISEQKRHVYTSFRYSTEMRCLKGLRSMNLLKVIKNGKCFQQVDKPNEIVVLSP
jgi:hypothetical protein